ncbi:MAG: DnaB-like helicase N-terminal domain-containing protein, partial [Planctomycetaceae bacterium]
MASSRRSGDLIDGEGRGRGRDGDRPRRDGPRLLSSPHAPPVDLEAERGVLGSIFLKPDVCDDISLVIRPADFADESHQILFHHILELHETAKRIDTTIVLDRLRSKGDLERIGGAAAIAEIIEAVPHAAHAIHYAHIVRDKA